jgi:hypothetical protein
MTLSLDREQLRVQEWRLRAGGIGPLQGPPGAGKTLYGASEAVERVKRGERVLMSAYTNPAANEFATALVGLVGLEEARKLAVRAGNPAGVGPTLPIKFTNDASILEEKPIIIDTTYSLKNLPRHLRFDSTIIDEAGIETVYQLLWPMWKVANKMAVPAAPEDIRDMYDLLVSVGIDATVVGDPKQGRPYTISRYDASSIEWLMKKTRFDTLRLTYRLPMPLDRLVDEFASYGGLRAAPPAEGRRLTVLHRPDPAFERILAPDGVVKFVDVRSSTEEMAGYSSWKNETEARLVAKIVQQASLSAPTSSISVVTCYTHQREQIRWNLYSLGLRDVRVLSVREALGSEADIVVFSLVRNNPAHVLGASGTLPDLNVAISRARRMFIGVGSIDMMYKGFVYIPQTQQFSSGRKSPARRLAWMIEHQYGSVIDAPRLPKS